MGGRAAERLAIPFACTRKPARSLGRYRFAREAIAPSSALGDRRHQANLLTARAPARPTAGLRCRRSSPPTSQPRLRYGADGLPRRDKRGQRPRLRAPPRACRARRRERTREHRRPDSSPLTGHSIPFGTRTQRRLDPTHAAYVAPVKRAAVKAVKAGVLLEDARTTSGSAPCPRV
jgi:hypothetical protein